MSLSSLARRVPRPQLSYANIASTAALVLALGTGTAYAANTVFSTDIVDGEVKNVDLATNAVNTGKIINGGVWAQDIKAGDLTGDQVQDESLGESDLGTNSVGATEVQDNSLDTGEIIDDSLFSQDLGPGSVGTSEVSDGTLTGADVANESLTLSDLVGANKTGAVSFGSIANGHCSTVNLGISGATAGDTIIVSAQSPMPAGMFLYGTQVASATSAQAVICNLSGSASPVISNLPVRVTTYH